MLWPTLREKALEQRLPLTVVAAEALHVAVLDALFARPESEGVHFQGGTCLRLVHGGYRYSEDLDFAGAGLDRAAAVALVRRAQRAIEAGAAQLLGPGEARWKWPDGDADTPIATFWLRFLPTTDGLPGSLPGGLRLKLELARFPVYEPVAAPVRSELDPLARRPLVSALAPRELLAEKVAALLGRRYLKGRDLFDLWYLTVVLRAAPDGGLLVHKLRDYAVAHDGAAVAARLAEAGRCDLAAEMERFLPLRHRRQLARDDYAGVRQAAVAVVRQALGAAEGL